VWEYGKITIGQLVDRTAARYPENEALVYPDRGLRYTYKEFREVCNKFAKGLLKLGVRKGDHTAIWATNVAEWVIAQFGCAGIGAVLVTVNTNYKLYELEYLLKQSDSKTLIMIEGTKNSDYQGMIYELCPELGNCPPGELVSERLPLLKNIIVIGNKRYPGMFSWEDIIKMGENVSDEELQARKAILDPDDIITIMYTSGTTGFPKGVMLTHHNLITNASGTAACMDLGPTDRVCIPVPFFHCSGSVSGNMCCVLTGATMVPVEVFDPAQVLKTVEKERCTVLHGVPTMFIMELELMEKEKFNTSSLRTGIMAGSPCPVKVLKKAMEVMNMREIVVAYGQTEASPGITNTRTSDPVELRISTVGRALPGVEVKIVNPETGEEVPRGVEGEICARGSNIMKGYYKMPEATAKAIDKDGWLHTGDLGIMDENGYCKFTCRLKDIIIRGGENISPSEIEEFIITHPSVKNVQVVGVPSSKYGEEVMAFIQLKEGQKLTQEMVQSFCKGKIANCKIPKYVVFVDSFPLNAGGKVQKCQLREIGIKMMGLEERVDKSI